MPESWTVASANAALPEVRRLLGLARASGSRLRDLQAHLNDLRIVHGDQVLSPAGTGYSEFAVLLATFQAERENYLALVADFGRLGVELKDVEQGLVDFRGKVGLRDAFLCWREGEAAVTHWHELESGFAGRRPIA
ncbi:MAG: DUF2203 domain-containing protein [Candidatus Thermoplasmatota archaeon]